MLSLPFIGSAVYVFVEIFPELLRSRTSQRAMRGSATRSIRKANLRRAENEMKVSGNVASRQKYADELVRLGRAAEAVPIYQNCLTGVFADDPKLLLGYAHAQFAAGDPAGARKTLDDLIGKNPEFRSPDGHLLYARALEGEGNDEKALAEYATLADYYPGAEAGVRYAKLLRRLGQRAAGPADAAGAAGPGQLRAGTLSKGPARVAGRGARANWRADYFLRLMERNETPSIMAL